MKGFILICLMVCVNSVFAQTEQPVNPQNPEQSVKVLDTVKWRQLNKLGLDINEVTFVNWNAGGANSISALLEKILLLIGIIPDVLILKLSMLMDITIQIGIMLFLDLWHLVTCLLEAEWNTVKTLKNYHFICLH